jgi:hypothetical protein
VSATTAGRLNRGLFATRSVATDRLVVGAGVVHRCQDEGDHEVLVTRDGRLVHRDVVRASRSGRLSQTDVVLGDRAHEKAGACRTTHGSTDDLAVGGAINCGVTTGSGTYRVQITRRSPDTRDVQDVLDTDRGISPDDMFWTVVMAPGTYELRNGRGTTPIQVVRPRTGSKRPPEPTLVRIGGQSRPNPIEVVAGSALLVTTTAGGRIELVPIRVEQRPGRR